MTIQEIIAYVDTMKPSAFTPEQKIIWLNEVEGMAQLDVMQLAQSDVIQYLYPDDKDHEPLVPPPHQKIYYTYMLAMIDFANGEYDQYQNTMALFNSFFTSYTRWFANTYRPANRNCLLQGYYLSAYSIAVKHGYSGSEEEWLATLKGAEGDRGIGISSVAKTATERLIDFYTITFDDGNTAEFSVHNGATGAKGDKGDIGATGATGAKGDTGATGNGVASFLKTAGTGEPGSTDTYTMTFTDGSVAVVTVYNGADGVTVDNVLSATSVNPVQNKVVKGTLDVKADLVDGVIPSAQLPSYVDDVIEAAAISTLPATGEAGKIYVTTNDNKTWRWSGSAYVEISASLALGETAATAYRGDRGAVSYAHSQSTGNPHGTTKSDIGLGNVDNTSDLNKPISTAVQTALNGKAATYYCTCSTAVSTAAKALSFASGSLTFTYSTIAVGDTMCCSFNNGNSASTPTLNVNSLGAKNIRFGSTGIASSSWFVNAACNVIFIWDGTYWQMLSICSYNPYATTSVPGVVTPSASYFTMTGSSLAPTSNSNWAPIVFPDTIFQGGTYSSSTAIAAASGITTTVSFPTTMASQPMVFIQMDAGSGSQTSWLIATTYNISTTGFTVYVRNPGGSSTSGTWFYNWFAMTSNVY